MPLLSIKEVEEVMQTTEREAKETGTEPASQPLATAPHVRLDESDEPEQIFMRAVAEIDTQPLPRAAGIKLSDVLQTLFCISLLGTGLIGIVWQAITYPHTLVLLYAREEPASITVHLNLPTRKLAPVTVTRSATAPTSGRGHQDARAASGFLTFYNGSADPQTIPAGTVFTGNDGVKVATDQTVIVPAANLPAIGQITVSSHATVAGRQGNIAALDLNVALSSDVKVRNEAPFASGRDAREYQAVAPRDVQTLTARLEQASIEAVVAAFPIRPGEAVVPLHCHGAATSNPLIWEEAQSVTVTTVKTCSAVAYNQDALMQQAARAFTQTRPAAHYHLLGSVETTLHSVSPLSVTLHGTWMYTFSPAFEQCLAQRIAGDTPAQAKAYLLSTGVISHVSIPNALPPAIYIDFFVLS